MFLGDVPVVIFGFFNVVLLKIVFYSDYLKTMPVYYIVFRQHSKGSGKKPFRTTSKIIEND